MARRLLLPLAALFFSSPVIAAGPGTSAAAFLNLGFGARPLGMGESFVAIADDVSALHYNPAGLALPAGAGLVPGPKRYEMLFSHALHIQDISLSQLGLVSRPFGLSLTNLRVEGIERRSGETIEPEGSFGASDLALGLSYGRRAFGIGLGGTVKFIRQTIADQSATAFAVDLGALRRFEAFPVSVGAGVANLGSSIRFIEAEAPLPLTLRTGVSVGMTKRFPHALSLQIDVPRDSGPVLRLGLEYLGFGPFALRAGFRTYASEQRAAVLGKALGSTASGLTEFYGMFMGVGFRSRLGNLDYSILPYGELGQAHRLSFSLRFGEQKPKPAAEVFQ